MATEATFTVPSDESPSAQSSTNSRVRRSDQSASFRVSTWWFPVSRFGAHSDGVVAAFADHQGVRNIQLADAVDDEYPLRAEWVAEYEGVLNTLAETEVPLIEAVGTDDQCPPRYIRLPYHPSIRFVRHGLR